MRFVPFVAEDYQYYHASSQGEHRNARKNENTKEYSLPWRTLYMQAHSLLASVHPEMS
jgi:hypothetical protein